MADDGQAEVLAAKHGFQPLRPFHIYDLGGNPDLCELGGDDLAATPRIGGRRQVQRGLKPVGIAGLGQERAGLVGIVGRHAREIDIGRVMRGEMRTDGCAVAKHRAVDDRLAINGMGQRLTHFHVVKGRLQVVGRQDRLPLGRAHEHLKAWVGIELGQVFRRREAGEGVDILGHHRGKGSGGVGDELERRAVQYGGRAPVIGVAFDVDLVALGPADKFERAGADGHGLDILDALR